MGLEAVFVHDFGFCRRITCENSLCLSCRALLLARALVTLLAQSCAGLR